MISEPALFQYYYFERDNAELPWERFGQKVIQEAGLTAKRKKHAHQSGKWQQKMRWEELLTASDANQDTFLIESSLGDLVILGICLNSLELHPARIVPSWEIENGLLYTYFKLS